MFSDHYIVIQKKETSEKIRSIYKMYFKLRITASDHAIDKRDIGNFIHQHNQNDKYPITQSIVGTDSE